MGRGKETADIIPHMRPLRREDLDQSPDQAFACIGAEPWSAGGDEGRLALCRDLDLAASAQPQRTVDALGCREVGAHHAGPLLCICELAVPDAFAFLENDASVEWAEDHVSVRDDLELLRLAVFADAGFGDVDLAPGTAAAEEHLLEV